MFIVPLTSSITPMETMSQKKQTESTDDGEATFFDVFESLVKNVKETDAQVQKDSVDLMLGELKKRLADKEVGFAITDAAKDYVIDNGFDPNYGARPLKRYLQKHVETLAAKLILADGVRAGDTILIDVKDGQLSASAVQKNA